MFSLEEQRLKEDALRNAELLTEEEEDSILSVEEIRRSVLSEFNRKADLIDEGLSRGR